nr:hypothetical protein [Tanacetum cinerariifolium]
MFLDNHPPPPPLLPGPKKNINPRSLSKMNGGDCDPDSHSRRSITKGLLDKAKGYVLGMKIVRDSSDGRASFLDSNYAMGSSVTRYGFRIQGCAGSWEPKVLHMMALSITEAVYMILTKDIRLNELLTESRAELREQTYYASVVEMAKAVCFLENHEMSGAVRLNKPILLSMEPAMPVLQKGCRINFPLLLKNFLKSLTAIAYSSPLLSEEDASLSLKTCLAFRKGSPFRPDSETNEPHLRTYQFWKKNFYEETHKLDDMTKLPNSQPKKIYEEDLKSEIVMVKMPSCMSFLGCTNAYDEPIGNLGKMGDEVENPSQQSTSQVLPSFEEYTPPVTYPKEVEETLETPMEVEPLDQMKLEDIGLNNHSIPISYKEVPILMN